VGARIAKLCTFLVKKGSQTVRRPFDDWTKTDNLMKRRCNILRLAVLVAMVGSGPTVRAQERVNSKAYADSLPVAGREAWGRHRFGGLLVDVRKQKSGATVTVWDSHGAFLSRRVFTEVEFEAVGGYSGLWLPAVQPLRNTFMIAKHGAYAGRTLLILSDGRLLEHAGGLYFYDDARKRLFLREDTDVDGLITVLDENMNVICASARPEDLRGRRGEHISSPSESQFLCLPELAGVDGKPKTARRK
jgi:hypothetical protein